MSDKIEVAGVVVSNKVFAGRKIFLATFAVACISNLARIGDLGFAVGVAFTQTCLVALVPIVLARSNPRRGYLTAVVLNFIFFILPLMQVGTN